ncbi:hypothetical protein ACSZMF_14305 [Aeromonas caviae]|uniref:hypothetical protein n=1 Tax=Aeromonas caviae TaxID=648 RepID=UPI003A45AC07
MSQERAHLLYLKGVVSEMPPEQQAKVAELADQLRAMLAENAGGEAYLAIAMVSMEAVIAEEGEV